MSDTAQGQYETASEVEGDQPGTVKMWLDAITLARKTEETWRQNATKACDVYRGEKAGAKKFNVLYANTQILLPSLWSAVPKPDIRRRYADKDPVGKVAARVLERAVSHAIDVHDFESVMRAAVLDMVLPGRGGARVRYQPVLDDSGALVGQDVVAEHFDWQDFTHGPGRQWDEVPWVAFELRLTREQLIDQFGNIGKTMELDLCTTDDARDRDKRDVPDIFKRATVYEIWDKQAREVLFIAKTVDKRPLRRVPDPLKLRDFWPMPRPLYDVADSSSLVPLVPYELYRAQAEELDAVTRRINSLVSMCRYRGLRDASIVELSRLADAKDGDFVGVENALQFATSGGGLDKAMWVTPIEVIARVIGQLEAHREAVKATIYEITGLSDILRGSTQASETATAQQIKFQSGSLRIQDRQREVQRFARDLVRIMAEIVGEHFMPETLAQVTGEQLPTPEMKQAAMMAAQGGQPVPPGMDQPTWEEVKAVISSDAMRGYRVEIETDSTIQQDVARQQQNAGQFVQGFGGFMQAVGPAVVSGAMPMDVATDLLTSFARSFKLGRQAEDALERMGEEARQPKPQGDDGAAAAAQAEAQAKQAEMQQAAALEQAKMQAAMQTKAAELQAKAASDAAQVQLERDRLALERDRFEFERETVAWKTGLEEEKMLLDARNKDADREASRPKPEVDEVEEAVKEAAVLTGLEQLAQAMAALQQGQAALLAAVQAPKRAVPVRGADGLISEVTLQPMVIN